MTFVPLRLLSKKGSVRFLGCPIYISDEVVLIGQPKLRTGKGLRALPLGLVTGQLLRSGWCVYLRLAATVSFMVRYSFLFFVVFLVGLLVAFSGQVATSVVPGWHTTIYPPWFFVSAFQLFWLGVASAIYFFMEKKGLVVNRKVFVVHTFLSLLIFFDNSSAYFNNQIAEVVFVTVPFILFLLGQVIFIVGVWGARRRTALQ